MFKNNLTNCYNIEDLRKRAKRRIPLGVFSYLDSFAEDGVCGSRNRSAFSNYQLLPRMLVDVEKVDTATAVLGEQIDFPIICAPTALSRLFHHEGEIAAARAAHDAGTIYSLSTLSSVSIEEVGAIPGPKWFQLYMYRDKGLVKEFIQRAKASGYQALCLTVDASIGGNREQDLRNGFRVPPRPTLNTILEAALHPKWCWDYVTKPKATTANVSGDLAAGKAADTTVMEYITAQLTPAITWKDVEWLREQFDGPILIKGVLDPEDAMNAVKVGAQGVVLSNHGGRQLDHAIATIDILPEMVDRVEGQLEIIIDSGIRRGTDVIKAMALGATACMVGRPYLYGLGAAGQAGVEKALEILRTEIVRDLQLLGCRSIAALDRTFIRAVK